MSGKPLITVFTPTYNRAHTLHRVFDSLRSQTLRDFEWLIVDDGSTDNTAALIAEWTKLAKFPIRYFKQGHSGKHIAHNVAAREARGQFFFPLDSDDACVPQALERMAYRWSTIPAHERASFCGVGGLSMDQNGELIGERFPHDPLDANMRERHYTYGVRGEKCVLMLTELVRLFPFPEVRGTNFVPEGTIWLEMAKTHKIRWVNEFFRIYYTGCQTGTGSTLTGTRNFRESASGRLHYYVWLLNSDLEFFFRSPKPFLKAALMLPIVTWTSQQRVGSIVLSLNNTPAKLLIWLALPLASLLYAIDKVRSAARQKVD